MGETMNQGRRPIVFLSGPMRGISREEGLEWRRATMQLLNPYFTVLHAYRGREDRERLPDPRLAVARDKADILRADIVLVVNADEKAHLSAGLSNETMFYESPSPIQKRALDGLLRASAAVAQ